MTPYAIRRRWARVVVLESGCWEWTGSRSAHGYGFVSGGYAHRWTYEAVNGPVPAGLELDHLCRFPSCVNPDHLEPVTHAENLRRSPLSFANVLGSRTHCKRGHEFNEANTLRVPLGRRCRRCASVYYFNRKRAA